jgi:hypothetical protein
MLRAIGRFAEDDRDPCAGASSGWLEGVLAEVPLRVRKRKFTRANDVALDWPFDDGTFMGCARRGQWVSSGATTRGGV